MIHFCWLTRVGMILSVALLLVPKLDCQAVAEVVRSTGAIPRDHYETWSLFLVCNPNWLAREKSRDLYSLYQMVRNFGRTIGDDNLAVWFWKETKRTDDPNLADNVDVERSVHIRRALR